MSKEHILLIMQLKLKEPFSQQNDNSN